MIKILFENFKVWIYWSFKKAQLSSRYKCVIEPGVRIKFPKNLQLGDNVKIASGVLIHCGHKCMSEMKKNVYIGDNSYIGPNSVLFGEGEIEIGRNCEIAPGVVITSREHTYSKIDVPIREQRSEFNKVLLEDDVWIGCNASILPGVSIGKGSIVGAGAVVTKNIAPYSVAVGVPAKVIKKRNNNE